jgi:hypothetical protein
MIKYFGVRDFEEIGKQVVVTILDVFEKNPFSKVGLPPAFKTMEIIRRETAFEVARNEKFRIEANSMKKARAFNKTI